MASRTVEEPEPLCFGYRIALHSTDRNGYVVGTASGIAPLGVAEDSPAEPLTNFEQAVFTIASGDRDIGGGRHEGEPVKFGSVVRLIHHKQHKAVTYNAKLHSVVDPANHRVTLESHDHGGDQWDKWRIMPRFKVRGEGERVCEGDHLVFQLSSGDKVFLGISKKKDEASDNCFEVHAGTSADGFALKIYDKDMNKYVSKVARPVLRAGDCVLLYHKEKHGYIAQDTTSGKFLLNPAPDDLESTMAGSMFVLELQNRYRGGVIYTGRDKLHRLKDLRTGMYLTAVYDTEQHNYESTPLVHFELAKAGDDPACLFAFHQIGETHGTLLKDRAKVFIECPWFGDRDGAWIGEGEPLAARKLALRDGYRLEQLHADPHRGLSRRRHLLRGHPALSHSDGIELQRVEDDVSQKLNIILSLLPPIQALRRTVATEMPEYSRVVQVQENLSQLGSMAYLDGHQNGSSRVIDHGTQRHLHDQGVAASCLALAKEIIQCPFLQLEQLRSNDAIADINQSHSSTALKYSDLFDVIELCFSVTQAVVKDRPQHAVALDEDMEFIVECIPYVPAALNCYLDCINNNVDLVDSNDSKVIRFFCNLFKQRCRCDGALTALSLLTCCGGRGIASNQQDAIGALLADRQFALAYFVRVTVASSEVQIAVPNVYFEENKKRFDAWALCNPMEGNTGTTWVSLTKLRELAAAKHLPQFRHFLDFMTAQMDFFAGVCAGKNSSAVAATMNLISLEAIIPCILSQDVPAVLRAAFVRFFTAAVLQTENTLDLREVCRSLHYVVREPMPLQLESEVAPMFDAVKQFALGHLADIATLSLDTTVEQMILADAVVRLVQGLLCRGLFSTVQYPGLVALLVAIVDSRDGAAATANATIQNRASKKSSADVGELAMLLADVQCGCLQAVDTILTFVVSKHAIDAVDRFCHGQRLPRISQLFDLDPDSMISDAVAQIHTKDSMPHLRRKYKAHTFSCLSDVLAACMDAAHRRAPRVRDAAIALFCRITAFPQELLSTVSEIQLLTNKSAALFYKEAKLYAQDLSKCTRQVFDETNIEHVAHVLDAIEQLLLAPYGGAQLDKIGTLRHLDVPEFVIAILRNLPSAPQGSIRYFVMQAVNFLGTVAQDDATAEFIVSHVDDIRHLITGDVDMLSLLRTLFVDRPALVQVMTTDTVKEIVSCLALPHSAVGAVLVLQDIVRTRTAYGRYINTVQNAVWRSLCGNYAAASVVRIKTRWTGRTGRAMRDELLRSAEYYNDMGFLRLHLEILKLVFYITKFNRLTRIEEVRHEMFGITATDDILEVVSNPELPSMFRKPYINLLQSLVIQDPGQRVAFFTHKLLPDFIAVCISDVQCLRKKLGETGTLIGQIEDTPSSRVAVEYEDLEESRNGVTAYLDLVLVGVVPCVKYICSNLDQLQHARITEKVLGQVMYNLNLLLDEVCDLVKFTHVVNTISDFPELAENVAGRKKLHKLLRCAESNGVRGTAAWAEDFESIVFAVSEQLTDLNASRMSAAEKADDVEYVTPPPAADASERQRWELYYKKNIAESPSMSPENEFATAAGVIIRAGPLGARFLKSACDAVLFLPEKLLVRVLSILRQVCVLQADHPFDDSQIIDDESFAVPDPVVDESEFQYRHSLDERQTQLATWTLTSSVNRGVLPAVVALISAKRSEFTVTCAVKTANQLLQGGHRLIQKTLNDSLQSRPDEEIFVFLRSQLTMFRDSLRQYNKIVLGGSVAGLPDPAPVVDMLLLCQRFCEGHYSDFQDYMRHQPDNQVSVNTLESFDSLLNCAIVNVEPQVVPLLSQLLATIAESIQGPCKANQDAFISLGIGDSIAKLIALSRDDASKTSDDDLEQLRRGAVTVLLSLLESRLDAPQLTSLVGSMSLRRLIVAMDRSHDRFAEAHEGLMNDLPTLESQDPAAELEDELAVGVQVFIFFKTCIDVQTFHGVEGFEFLDRERITLKTALGESRSYKFINKCIAAIEVNRGSQLERVYFRIPSISRFNLHDKSKEELIKNINRDSDAARVLDFFERCQTLILELEYYEKMRKVPVVSIVHRYSDKLDILSVLVAAAINITLLATLHGPKDLYSPDQDYGPRTATDNLAIAHIVLQCILFVHFFFGPMQVYLDARWLKWQDDENEAAAQESRANLSIYKPDIRDDRVETFPRAAYVFWSVWFLLFYGKFWQRVLVLVAAFLGYFQSRIWYSVQLLQVVTLSPQLYNVVLAVTQNGGTLLQTFGLQVIVILIFANISYAYYSGIFQSPGESFSCHSLLNCLLVHVDTGLRRGGGIADALPSAEFHDSFGAGRFFFNVLFFIIVVTIFLNIVFGVIVDTFGALREEREAIDEDQKSKCFICGIDGNEFDRVTAGGFEHHITSEHNMWHYLFFLHYVKIKPADQLNGVEFYVRELVELNEPAFFPVGKALLLEKHATSVARLQGSGDASRGGDKAESAKGSANSSNKEVAELASQLSELTARIAKMRKMADHSFTAPVDMFSPLQPAGSTSHRPVV